MYLGATDNGIPGRSQRHVFLVAGPGSVCPAPIQHPEPVRPARRGQWTDEPLLALEQFSVGGFETVRGYLENQLVRDRGIVSSVEFRVPVLFNKAGAGIVQLAPFFDFGGAWNVEGSPSPTSIYSIGVGLLVSRTNTSPPNSIGATGLNHVDIPDNSGCKA